MKRQSLPVRLPLGWFIEIPLGTVDCSKPGIYQWLIDEREVYIGQYTDSNRPRNEYRRNIENLLKGKPYRKNKPDKFRKIHHHLKEAVLTGRKITLTLLENQPKKEVRNRRERELIAERIRAGLTVLNSSGGSGSAVRH
jgi:hypothetical protein